jgi:deoxycytidine triphosphate deaminase
VRHSTYDATVGEIINEGSTHYDNSFVLPARGMVWVVSRETFSLPQNVTGLATLRTTWTHNGILALNVGVVDPGWNGPLATALVNFSNSNFEIVRGNGFLRVLFLTHAETSAVKIEKSRGTYLSEIREKSSRIPSTFLNLKSLADEVLANLSGSSLIANRLARYGVLAGFVALLLALYAILIPIVYGITSEFMSRKADLQRVEEELRQAQIREGDLREKMRTLESRFAPALSKPPQ